MMDRGYLTTGDINNILKRHLKDAGISTIHELIDWFESGRQELLKDPAEAAKELGVSKWLMHSILASQAFRREYFMYVFYKSFNPQALQMGMQKLVEDFVSGKTAPRDRLAMFRAIQELFGIFPKQIIEQNINQRTVSVNLRITATPEDFKDGHQESLGTVQAVGELADGGEADARRVPDGSQGEVEEVVFAEIEE